MSANEECKFDAVQSRRDRSIAHLRNAVTRIRAAAADAERAIDLHQKDPGRAAACVMHVLAWGNANATSCIESAIDASEDAHLVRLLEAEVTPSQEGQP